MYEERDVTGPYIKKVTPTMNASDVPISSYIAVEFSERMKERTLTDSTNVGLFMDPLEPVGITVEYFEDDANSIYVLTIKPDDYLEIETRYSVVVSGTVMDYHGNRMGGDSWWNFWTGTPVDYVTPSGVGDQPETPSLSGYLEVLGTSPVNYTTNYDTDSLSTLTVTFNDMVAVGNRNYFGGTGAYSAYFGGAYFEDAQSTLSGYISVDNREVLGDPSEPQDPPSITIVPSGQLLLLNTTGMLDNNEYIVTVKSGIPGISKNPLQEDYKFVFTSTYTPLYIGYNAVRLYIGPILQITNSYVPNDTLNRMIYSVSKEADRISPVVLDPSAPPWYVSQFVLYQVLINCIYAAMMMFTSSGAGVSKTLGDLSISMDSNKMMPALEPILNDYRKLRDKYAEYVERGTDMGVLPESVIRAATDPRRPITDGTWRRLPFVDPRISNLQVPVGTTDGTWLYTYPFGGIGLLTREPYLSNGQYITTWDT